MSTIENLPAICRTVAGKLHRPPGHGDCRMSLTILGQFSFGRGQLNHDGTYEFPCPECARNAERQMPEIGPCHPPA